MNRKKKIDPAFYDNHDFSDDLIEAKRNGDLIITRSGENFVEAIRRHMALKIAAPAEEPRLLRKVG